MGPVSDDNMLMCVTNTAERVAKFGRSKGYFLGFNCISLVPSR